MLEARRKLEGGSKTETTGAGINNVLAHMMYGMTSSTVMKRPMPGHLYIDQRGSLYSQDFVNIRLHHIGQY